MSIFSKILSKLGFGESPKPTAATSTSASAAGSSSSTKTSAPAASPPQSEPNAISQVDVAAQLERMASANPEKLNWKTSIVDLLKLLGIDSSLTARKELATELHAPPDKMNDSAQMNMWLHKTVMQKLAENGGKVPAELLS